MGVSSGGTIFTRELKRGLISVCLRAKVTSERSAAPPKFVESERLKEPATRPKLERVKSETIGKVAFGIVGLGFSNQICTTTLPSNARQTPVGCCVANCH